MFGRDYLCAQVESDKDTTKDRPKLNPDWEEWLMGWPTGWSSLEPLKNANIMPWTADPADLDSDHENYVPRLIKTYKERPKRVEALGNGQVPQSLIAAFIILMNHKTKGNQL